MNKRIRHAGNVGEQTVLGRLVDGLDDKGTVYQFHGCFWHSCPRCFPNREAEHPVKKGRDAQREPRPDNSLRTRTQKQWSRSTRPVGVRLQG